MTYWGTGPKQILCGVFLQLLAFLAPKLCKFWPFGEPQMTFWGIWGKTKVWGFCRFFSQVFDIFGPQNMQIWDHWRPPNDFLRHLGQNNLFAVFILHFWPPKCANCAHFGHGRHTNDSLGHLGQNGNLLPATVR